MKRGEHYQDAQQCESIIPLAAMFPWLDGHAARYLCSQDGSLEVHTQLGRWHRLLGPRQHRKRGREHTVASKSRLCKNHALAGVELTIEGLQLLKRWTSCQLIAIHQVVM